MAADKVFHLVADLLIGKDYKDFTDRKGVLFLSEAKTPIIPDNYGRHLSESELDEIRDYFGGDGIRFVEALDETRRYPNIKRAVWCKIILQFLTDAPIGELDGSPVHYASVNGALRDLLKAS